MLIDYVTGKDRQDQPGITRLSLSQVEQETQARHVRRIGARRDRLPNRLHKVASTLALRKSSVTRHTGEKRISDWEIMLVDDRDDKPYRRRPDG